MPKQLEFHETARRSLKRGVDVVAAAVKTTLGPRGRNVALAQSFGAPTVTHDGVTVALDIELPDPFANMGARLLIDVANTTNDVAGDGTTTATVLAQAILAEGTKVVAAGANPMLLKRGLDRGAAALVAELQRQALPVRDRADIAHVAAISAGDAEIGELIATVMDRTGNDGVITIEEGQGLGVQTEYIEGMQLDRGYSSPYFVTDAQRMEVALDAPYILVTDQKIASLQEILPVLEEVMPITRNIVIIAEAVEGEALSALVVNKLRGSINGLAVQAPGFGDGRKALLADIAVLTGATVISAEAGRTLDSAMLEDLGRARRVVATKDTTTIIGGGGDEPAIRARVAQLRAQAEASSSDVDREKLQGRLAKLSGGVAVITVGAATETELKERKQRVEDALSATRAAVAEGVVPGGGVALINALPALDGLAVASDDERFGLAILRRALEEPLRQLAANAGEEGAVIIAAVRRLQQERGDSSYGYNVLTGAFGNMLEMGVVDPVKVTRSALQNAVSIAGLLLTVEALIADSPEDGAVAGHYENGSTQ